MILHYEYYYMINELIGCNLFRVYDGKHGLNVGTLMIFELDIF
jgi:hypothetical protein